MATPSESAALGAMGTLFLALAYKRLNWKVLKESLRDTLKISTMVLMIITGSTAFAQILAFTGATRGLAELVIGVPLAPIFILISMQIILLILGMFMEQLSIMMITIPIYLPIVNGLGLDSIWFATIFLLNMEMAVTTPPFGLSLFVMKGVAPPGTTMGDIYKAGLPFLGCDLIVMALMLAFPVLALWLPGLMLN